LIFVILALQTFDSEIGWYFALLIPCIIAILINTFRNTSSAHKNEHITKEIEDTAESISSSVEELNVSTSEISASTEEISTKAQRLNSMSKNIGSIITTMKKAAEKSRLLALNASIEAARAGDHGRGFGAVSEQFTEMSNDINDGAEQSLKPAIESIYLIEELSENLEEISAACEQLPMVSESILINIQKLIKKNKEVK